MQPLWENDSVSRAFCVAQVKRLAVVPLYFPQTKEGVEEILQAFHRHGKSESHVERVITRTLESTEKLHNVVAEIVRLCFDLPKEAIPALPEGCRNCLGMDYVIVEVRGATGAKRCGCQRGRRLAELDTQRGRSLELDVRRT